MQKFIRIAAGAILIGLCVWGWFLLFPSPQHIIRKQLKGLAATASFRGNEGPLAKAYNAEKLSGYFATDVVVVVDIPGHGQQSFEGLDTVLQAAMAARQSLSGLKAEFLDINVTVGPDKQSATVNLTAKGTVPGESDFFVQEMKFAFKKVDGKWLISKVETIRTLS